MLFSDTIWFKWLDHNDCDLGNQLKEAYELMDATFRPFPSKKTPQNMTLEDALGIWETSEEISIRVRGIQNTDEPLVDAMTHLVRFVSPDPRFDQEIRSRLERIGDRIQSILLQQTRQNHSEKHCHDALDDETHDVNLLCAWSEEIHKDLLANFEHDLQNGYWAYTSLPRIFEHLKVFDLSCPVLMRSKFPLTLREIITAPCIPIIWGVRSLREQAFDLLERWCSLPTVQSLPEEDRKLCGLTLDDLLSPVGSTPESTNILRCPEEIVRILDELLRLRDELEAAVSVDTLTSLPQLVDQIGGWGRIEDPTMTEEIKQALSRIERAIRNVPQMKLIRSKIDDFISLHKGPVGSQRVIGFSYREPVHKVRPFVLVFKPIKVGAHDHWSDIEIKSHPEMPLQQLKDLFFEQINLRDVHPLTPIHHFVVATAPSDQSDSSSFRFRSGYLLQGRLSSLNLDIEHPVLYYHASSSGVQIYPHACKFFIHRNLPPSCDPPAHWYAPTRPKSLQEWLQVNSLAFTSDGRDLWPGATYPPVITKYVYVPQNVEKLCSPGSHASTKNDYAPIKLRPPLTADQAMALVGRTVQYEEPATKGQKRKRNKNKSEPDWDHVYIAFIWGFDPQEGRKEYIHGLVHRVNTGRSESTEMRRVNTSSLGNLRRCDFSCSNPIVSTTFLVAVLDDGEVALPPSFPSSMALRAPFRPKWIGAFVPNKLPEPEKEPKPNANRIFDILRKARRFEVGIAGDCAILAGELTLHHYDSGFFAPIENCKPGIWEGGCLDTTKLEQEEINNADSLLWVQWVDDGTIDLTQPVESFADADNTVRSLPDNLIWQESNCPSVDGGMISILARGITDQDAMIAMTGDEDLDISETVRAMALHAAEEETHYMPGGVSTGTMSDGFYQVLWMTMARLSR